jgi:16S rRNA processing protein RimM
MAFDDQTRGEGQDTGSPPQGEPVFLAVGRFHRPHGIQGEIFMELMTDFPERLRRGKRLFVGEEHRPMRLASVRQHQNGLLVSFKEYDTPEGVAELRNKMAYVTDQGLPTLPEGEYYHHQLMGLSVLDEDGKFLGVLSEILETGANDVYLVKTSEDKELLIPALESVLLEVNLEQGTLRVRLPEYL